MLAHAPVVAHLWYHPRIQVWIYGNIFLVTQDGADREADVLASARQFAVGDVPTTPPIFI